LKCSYVKLLLRQQQEKGEFHLPVSANALCSWLSPELNILELDMRHNGDAIYLSFYGRILRQKKKTKIAALLLESAR
jgi:hypothetical protein